jgi:hypothetical protein
MMKTIEAIAVMAIPAHHIAAPGIVPHTVTAVVRHMVVTAGAAADVAGVEEDAAAINFKSMYYF